MTNTKTTKRSLLASVMALFLCFTMLLGTTFAWFTDSVTSANNIIKAGNLDIELYHSDKAITDEKVGESTKLFDEVALWEPGVMVWEELTVKNEGDLALKYQLTLNVLEATEIDGVSFASMLKVALVDDGFEYTRENVEAIAADEWQDLATFTLAGKLDKTENDVYGIVIWWQPSDNDNLFNMNNGNKGKEVSVQVGVTLLATQLEAENDAFGNDYDEDAWVEGYKVYSAEDLNAAIANGETEIALMADVELEEPIVIPAPAVATYSARNAVVIDLNGKTITGAVGRDAEGNRVHVIVNNGNAVIKNGTVTSAGVNGGSAIYNAEGATLTVEDVILNGAPQEGETWPSYTVNNYGTLTVTDSSIYGVQGIIATNNTANTTVNNVIAYRDGWSSGHVFYTSSTAKVTVNGGIYTNDGNGVDGTLIYGGETVINGGTFILQEGTYFALFADSKLTVNDGDFSNIKSVLAWGGAMTVNGGTFGFDPTAYVGSGYKATEANGVWTVAFPQESFDALIDGAADDATIEIPAGTYTFPAADLKAGQTLNCAPGTVFEGAKLNANGATIVGATFSNAAQSNTVNGIYKDCTFTGSNGLRWGYAGDVVVFENCVFSGSTYGVHFDGGATKVVFKNCTFSGFNAMAGSIELVTFEGCTFVANGKSNYNGINMWGNTEMTNCTFVFDGTADYEWIDLCAGNTYATFTNCVVTDGEKEYGVEEYVSKRENSGVITVDGKQIVHNASAR